MVFRFNDNETARWFSERVGTADRTVTSITGEGDAACGVAVEAALRRGFFVFFLVVLIACQHQPMNKDWRPESKRVFKSEFDRLGIMDQLEQTGVAFLHACPTDVEGACVEPDLIDSPERRNEVNETKAALLQAGFSVTGPTRSGGLEIVARGIQELERLVGTGLIYRISWNRPYVFANHSGL